MYCLTSNLCSLASSLGRRKKRDASQLNVRLDTPLICTEFHFLKLWNGFDRAEHK